MSDQQHYYTPHPEVESAPEPVAIRLPDVSLDLVSDRGVFSTGHLDRGTELLLRTAPAPPAEGAVLDIGCGYGAIAIVVAKRSPGAMVWAVDVNERAVELTRVNATRAGISNVHACTPDAIPDTIRFSAIYSNPPVRVGKETLHALLEGWLDRLEAPGHGYLVVQRHLGADSLAAWLDERGYPTERLRSRQGYRILDVTPRPPGSGKRASSTP